MDEVLEPIDALELASLILAFALALAAPAVAAPPPVVSDVRVGQNGNHTRFVLEPLGKGRFRDLHARRSLPDRHRLSGGRLAARPGGHAGVGRVGEGLPLRPLQAGPLAHGHRPRLACHASEQVPAAARRASAATGWCSISARLIEPSISQRQVGPTDTHAESAAPVETDPEVEMAARAPAAKRVVVIDAGHGGVDPGATGIDGTHEKDLVLALAKSLRDALERTGKYVVVMSRDSDIFLSLKARVAVGRRARADLFISLHAELGARIAGQGRVGLHPVGKGIGQRGRGPCPSPKTNPTSSPAST